MMRLLWEAAALWPLWLGIVTALVGAALFYLIVIVGVEEPGK